MNTSALAILIACSPPAMRGRVLGIASMGLYAGISLGPGLAGLIGSTLGWRWLFLSVIPVGILALVLIKSAIKTDWKEAADKPFDWRGALFYTAGIICLSGGGTWILEGAWAVGLMAVGGALLALFVLAELKAEKRGEQPILDVRFLGHNPVFMVNVLASFINNSTVLGLTFYFSLYLQGIRHLDVFQAGLLLTVGPAIQLVLSPFCGRLADKRGPARIATLGIAVQGVGLYLASLLAMDSGVALVIAAQAVFGMGLALFGSPNTSAIMGSVDPAHLSQASGLVGTVRTMGMLLSMIIVSVSMNYYLGLDQLNDGNGMAFMQAMHMNINLFNALNIVAILCSLLQLHRRFAGQTPAGPKPR